MGRVKLQIKKIENITNRQVTFSKRRNGLIKKAYELSVLCDIYIALIMFSPSGRVSHFSGKRRIEEVLTRYINLADHERGGLLQNREYLISTLKKIKDEEDMAHESPSPSEVNSNSEELQEEISSLQNQLLMAEEQLSIFEPDVLGFTSMDDLESCEKNLLESMERVTQRKNFLMGDHVTTFEPPAMQMNSLGQMYFETQEGMPSTSFQNLVSWMPENGDHNQQYHMFGGSDHSCPSLRSNSPTTIYNYTMTPHTTTVNPVLNSIISGSHIDNPTHTHHIDHPDDDEKRDNHNQMSEWYHGGCASTDQLFSSLIPRTPSSFTQTQDDMGVTSVAAGEEVHQVTSAPEVPSSTGEDGNFGSNEQLHHVEPS